MLIVQYRDYVQFVIIGGTRIVESTTSLLLSGYTMDIEVDIPIEGEDNRMRRFRLSSLTKYMHSEGDESYNADARKSYDELVKLLCTSENGIISK
jgi:hypothetical protein